MIDSSPTTPSPTEATTTTSVATPAADTVPLGAQPSTSPAAAAHAYLPPHIVVLVHGNNGAPSDFDAVERALLRKFGAAQVLTIKSAVNHTQTALGVEIGGTRLAQEVYETIFQYELHPDVESYKLSIVAHSLGGLYARFAIVQLLASLRPLNMAYVSFVTICTPHLGSRRPRGDSTLKNVWRMGVHTVLGSRTIYGQTGIDLLVDAKKSADEADSSSDSDSSSSSSSSNAPPLLEAMSQPDLEFVTALQQFQFGTLVAMTDGDVVVPYASASIRNFNPYPSNALTERFSDWRWHIHHSGFASAPSASSEHPSEADHDRDAAFVRRLDAHVDQDIAVPDITRGVDVTASERFPSVDGYDADNKQEVEFSYEMIKSLQHAMPWRRIDVTVEPLGVKGKLRLHDWPIHKMQPPGCRADEFIDLLCTMLGHDHAMNELPVPTDAPTDDDASSSQLSSVAAGASGIGRIFERFQKRSASTSQSSSEGASGGTSSQLSPTSAGAVGAEPSPAASDSGRSSFVNTAGLNRLFGKFQRKDSFIGAGAATPDATSAQPSPMTSESETPRLSLGAGLTQMLDRFQKRAAPATESSDQSVQSTPARASPSPDASASTDDSRRASDGETQPRPSA